METLTAPTKAVIGTVIAAVAAFISPVLTVIIQGDPVTPGVWATAVAALLVFGGIAFPSIYTVTNRPLATPPPDGTGIGEPDVE